MLWLKHNTAQIDWQASIIIYQHDYNYHYWSAWLLISKKHINVGSGDFLYVSGCYNSRFSTAHFHINSLFCPIYMCLEKIWTDLGQIWRRILSRLGGRYKGGFKDRFVVNAVVANGRANGTCQMSFNQKWRDQGFYIWNWIFFIRIYQNISQINSYIRPLQLPLDSISSESGHNSVFIWTPVLFTFHSYPDSGIVRIPVLFEFRDSMWYVHQFRHYLNARYPIKNIVRWDVIL